MKSQVVVKNKPDLERVNDSLNTHGVYFKQAVRRELERLSNVRILGEEYPVNYLEGGALDLLIEVSTKSSKFVIPIECKRCRVGTKQWIFFEDKANYSKLIYRFEGMNCTVEDAGKFTALGFPICVEGVEIEKNIPRNEEDYIYKADSDPISKAINQACKGSMGLIIDEILNRKKLVEDQNILPTFSIIPILVTTAKLFLANTDVESININSGNYESNFSYKPVEWVILSYPYTPSLHQTAQRLEINIPEYRNFESRGLHTKEGIIVVTVSGLVSFIDKLNSLAK